MRTITFMLGAAIPFVIFGCVGVESDSGMDEEDVKEVKERFIGVDPVPHGKAGVLSACTHNKPCLGKFTPVEVRK